VRTEYLDESAERTLSLSDIEASALILAGSTLSSKTGRYGEPDDDTERTVVRVRPAGAGQWHVVVSNAIGVIALKDLQVIVRPKIPLPHILYLFGRSGEFPRLDEELATVAKDRSLLDLVATWFVTASETVLRLGLVRDYQQEADELSTARGRIEPLQTARLYYAGRLAMACEYEEFGFDTELNRILRAAGGLVTEISSINPEVRRRSRRVVARLEEASELRYSDLRASVDRRTLHYANAWLLARSLLTSFGRSPTLGSELAWTFLIRTPEMIEAGIRSVLQEHLGPKRVWKKGMHLPGSTLTVNPDLIFGQPAAIGDVKYKLSSGEWVRPDLYQVVAFASAFRMTSACLLRFRGPLVERLVPVQFGDINVSEVTWMADPLIRAADAATMLAAEVRSWLEGLHQATAA
jgi:5-methylcytosine-specific restriction enzyme subunit McrC